MYTGYLSPPNGQGKTAGTFQLYPPKAHEVNYLSDEFVLATHSKLADYLRMKVADDVSNRADVQIRVVSDFHPIQSAYYGQAGSLHVTDVAYVENYQSLSRFPVLEGGRQPGVMRPSITDTELITINSEVEQIPQLIGLIKFMLDANMGTRYPEDDRVKPRQVEGLVNESIFNHGENVDNAWFDLVHDVKVDLSPYSSHPDYIGLVEHLEANATVLSAMGDGSAKIMIEAWLNPEKDIQAHELPELDVTF